MDIKRQIELIAIKKIPGFDPKKHMNSYYYYPGYSVLASLTFWHFLMEVQRECDVFIPKYLMEERLRRVSDVVAVVENLKRVKVVEGAWVPCAWDGTRQCWFMSNGRKTLRSNISPNTDFCNAVSCGWHASWVKMAKIK